MADKIVPQIISIGAVVREKGKKHRCFAVIQISVDQQLHARVSLRDTQERREMTVKRLFRTYRVIRL